MSVSPKKPRVSRVSLMAGATLVLLGGAAAWRALSFDDASRAFPLVLAALLALTGAGIFLKSLLRPVEEPRMTGGAGGVPLAMAIVALWALAFGAGAGFVIPTFFMQAGLLWLGGMRRPVALAATAGFITVAAYLLFVTLLDIPLPPSLLPDSLQAF